MNLRLIFPVAAFLVLSFSTAEARQHHYRSLQTATDGYIADNNGRMVYHPTNARPSRKSARLASHGRTKGITHRNRSLGDGMGNPDRAAPSNGYDMAQEGLLPHPAGCPSRAFCGCGVSVRIFGHPVRDLYLARNWKRFPRTAPAPGMVAIFRGGGHVALILAVQSNREAILYNPNSGGHQTRIHTRSIANAIIVDPHGAKIASLR